MSDYAPPPIDGEVAAVLNGLSTQDLEAHRRTIGMGPDGIENLRKINASLEMTDEQLGCGGRLDVRDHLIPGMRGAPDIPALILTPTDRDEVLPCIYFTSCGGKIIRGNRSALDDFLAWLVDLRAVGVIVAPRVGPEDPHPAQVEDAYAGLLWTTDHAEELGIDAHRIVILGKSGGGGIAAATALYARDHGGPTPTHQVLIYPMLDDRELTASSKFEGIPWDRKSNLTGWTAMLGESSGGLDVSAYAAPSRATDLTGLPATFLDCGGSEVFRDEIIDYATRLVAAGVPVELHVWAGALHGSEYFAPEAEVSRRTLEARTSYLRRALSASQSE